MKNFHKAIEYYEKSLIIGDTLDDRRGKSICHKGLGATYHALGKFYKSIEYYKKAIKTMKEIGDKVSEAICYKELGDVYESLGTDYLEHEKFQKGIEYIKRSLEIVLEIDDKIGAARCYVNLGNAELVSDPSEAMEYYKEALKIVREAPDKEVECTCYAGLGISYTSLGEFHDAIGFLNKSLKIGEESEDYATKAMCYESLGNVCYGLGDFQRAIEYYNKSLEIMTVTNDKKGKAACYLGMGVVYVSLGGFNEAIKYFEKSLNIAEKISNKITELRCYLNTGIAYSGLKEWNEAIRYYKRCLEICEEVDDKRVRSACYIGLGNAYRFSEGNINEAIEWYQKALEIKIKIGDKVGQANCYANLGSLYFDMENFKKSVEYYEESLNIAERIGDKKTQSQTYYNLARVHHRQKLYQKSLNYAKESLKLIGLMKETLMQEDLSLSFLKYRINVYELGMDTALNLYENTQSQDYLKEALEILERTKSRELVKILNIKKKEDPAIEEDCSRLKEIESQIVVLETKLKISSSPDAVQRLENLYLQKAKVSDEIYLKSLDPSSLTPTLDLKLIDLLWKELKKYKKSVSILEMYIQEYRILYILFDQGNYRFFETWITKDLVELANEYINREQGYKHTGSIILERFYLTLNNLIDHVFPEALRDELSHLKSKDLFIIPHSWLHQIAWEAVMLDGMPLGVKYNLTRHYSLDLLKFSLAHQKKSNKAALIVSDPTCDLGIKEREIVESVLVKQNYKKKILEREKATLNRVRNDLPNASLIHFHCHAKFNLEEPLASEILLNDQSLIASDIALMAFEHYPFIFLSACESGQAKPKDRVEQIIGDEQIGFVRAFMMAKSHSIIATNWRVDVEVAKKFVEYFYEELPRNELGEAIRIARAETYKRFKDISRDWAAYVLYGNPYIKKC